MGLFGRRTGENAKEKTEACSCGCSANTQSTALTKEDAAASDLTPQQTGKAVTIKVLGSGCKNCQALYQNAKAAISASNINADVEYVTDMQEVAKYGVMSMPALVVNEQVVSMGKVLKSADVQKLLKKTGIV